MDTEQFFLTCCPAGRACCGGGFFGYSFCADELGCPKFCPPDQDQAFCNPPEHCVQDPETQTWGCQ